MKINSKILAITMLSLFSLNCHAEPNIVGNYTCNRVSANGQTNNHTLNISKTDETYTFQWDDSNGNPTMYGTGLIQSKLPNVIATTFWNISNDENTGVEIFAIKSDDSLQGDWLLQSTKDNGSETCSRQQS